MPRTLITDGNVFGGKYKAIVSGVSMVLIGLGVIWFMLSANPDTPAGYVGYLTQSAILGKARFYGLQTGPTSPGRTWLLSVQNISITPYTYTEDFVGEESVLSKDNLKINFRVHVIWNVRPDMVKEFVERYSTIQERETTERVVVVAYNNFLKEPIRTFAREEVQSLNGLEVKNNITPINNSLDAKVSKLTAGTPFAVKSIVVGNIQYPAEVANAVAEKMAATQILERKQTEISIEEQEKQKRIIQAEGIAKATEIIQAKLTNQYLQHEAIEAQKAMAGSQNHTTIYIPVGAMGVPLVGTFDTGKK
ncbi:MAG: hypothetical protein HZA78_02365 [Candidatus Schekmanbacteria bacterium]|nr:hypothetical protein [Candidatus Schekmanbacteria bacterium]